MVSGRGFTGRRGGQIGRGSGGSERGRSSNEKSEAEKKRSDAARLRGSYPYSRYGVALPPAFSKRESAAYRRRFSSPSAASSSSSTCPPTVPVKLDLEDAPAFAPGDFVDEAELERILLKLGEGAGFKPRDFVDDNHLDTVIGLVSQTTRREADKAEEWRLVAEEQCKIFVDLGSDGK